MKTKDKGRRRLEEVEAYRIDHELHGITRMVRNRSQEVGSSA
jgi:hypothetical protein